MIIVICHFQTKGDDVNRPTQFPAFPPGAGLALYASTCEIWKTPYQGLAATLLGIQVPSPPFHPLPVPPPPNFSTPHPSHPSFPQTCAYMFPWRVYPVSTTYPSIPPRIPLIHHHPRPPPPLPLPHLPSLDAVPRLPLLGTPPRSCLS